MVSSTRQAIACILVIFVATISAYSQIAPAKQPTASVSGKVTIKGKAASGIPVAVFDPNTGGQRMRFRDTTDHDGNYRVVNLPAGTYQVLPVTSAFVLDEETNRSIFLSEGEAVEGINFNLVPGGVITGRVTDADGQPLIEEFVSVIPLDPGNSTIRSYLWWNQTDDRGIYRVFGLREGKYKVSVGQDHQQLPGYRQQVYKQTFYPSVPDAARATVIEVTEGSETKNIDIIVGRPVTTFKVTGLIVDGDSGNPIPNVRYGLLQKLGNSSHSSSGSISNAKGEFRLDNVVPGKYSVFIEPSENSNLRAEWVSFEVVDRDVSGVVIRTSKGATLSGVVVLEGADEKTVNAKLSDLSIYAWVESRMPDTGGSRPVAVSQDGSFRVSGLGTGIAHLGFASTSRNNSRQVGILRIERNGISQPPGIEIKEGEDLTGIRVVARYYNGAIRGVVKPENGEFPANSRISIWLTPLEPASRYERQQSSPEVDARGRFFMEGVAAGTYELNVAVAAPPLGRGPQALTKQQVIVVDNVVTEVTVSVELKSDRPSGGP